MSRAEITWSNQTLSEAEHAKDTDDARFMALALALGRRGLGRTWPNPAVGAVIVRDDGGGPVIVGRGWTQAGGRPHAETEALRRAGDAARGATLYTTLEPCSHYGKTPPCADAIIAAGIARVVSALVDPNPEVAGAGHWRMAQAGIVVEVGLGAEEARRAHAGHIRRVQDGRPQVILKLAVSADGKAGLAGRRPTAITGEAARERVHLMRATSDAVANRHRHGAGGRPAAHLPVAGHGGSFAGARRARRHAAAASSEQALGDGTRHAALGRHRRGGAARARAGAACARCRGLSHGVVGRHARPRRRVEAVGRARHHPAHGRGGTDPGRGLSCAPIWWTKRLSFAHPRRLARMASTPSTACRFPH